MSEKQRSRLKTMYCCEIHRHFDFPFWWDAILFGGYVYWSQGLFSKIAFWFIALGFAIPFFKFWWEWLGIPWELLRIVHYRRKYRRLPETAINGLTWLHYRGADVWINNALTRSPVSLGRVNISALAQISRMFAIFFAVLAAWYFVVLLYPLGRTNEATGSTFFTEGDLIALFLFPGLLGIVAVMLYGCYRYARLEHDRHVIRGCVWCFVVLAGLGASALAANIVWIIVRVFTR